MTEFSVKGQRVVVMGAARSGVAAARLLAERGARVTLTDLREDVPDGEVRAGLRQAGITLELGRHDPETLAGAALVVLSPGVPTTHLGLESARQAGASVIGEVELASRWLRGRVVAVTGTKGKSTTSVLAGRMLEAGGLKATVGGNIGVPLSAQVPSSTPDTVHVVEVSSFQLEATDRFHPWIAVLLNVTVDHLDRHASFAEYAQAKARVFRNQQADDWAVVNADDPGALALANAGRARRFDCAVQREVPSGVMRRGDALVSVDEDGEERLIPLSAVKLPGTHLLMDVAAAAAVAHLSGVSATDMARAVAAFEGLEHVLETVAVVAGTRFVNDSKATNVAAARHAIEAFDTGLVVILGGRYKGGDFGDLRAPLVARGARVVAIGEARARIRDGLAPAVPVQEAASMEDAVRRACEWVPRGATVLLAPACSSLDMFSDYAARGRAFRRAVEALPGVRSDGETAGRDVDETARGREQ